MLKSHQLSIVFAVLTVFTGLTLFAPETINAQRRDYFTDQEIELVRDANEIDKRIDVLVKAIDRRFLVINSDNSQAKQVSKDLDKWGELPTGSRLELLSDISEIFQKAIDDIDDLASRKEMNENISKGTSENETDIYTKQIIKANDKKFPIAVHTLADASKRILITLESLNKTTTDQKEKGLILSSIESCNMIIEASANIERPSSKKKND